MSATAVPLTPMRRAIAARMTEAVRAIPHFRVAATIDMGALLAARTRANGGALCTRLSLNDFVVRACALALVDTPAVNVQWGEGAILRQGSADISIVVAVDGGLATPVLRSADAKDIWQIAEEVRALATRAAGNALKMSDVIGGTFSISNLGMHGVDEFDAIINPPQCAILAVGRVMQGLVARDGAPAVADVAKVTLSADHRAIDGADAGAFLTALRRYLEDPESLLAPVEHRP
nr:dihydrolipoamide acetyltransferase family protein [Sphingomonas sp. Y57]